MRKSYDEPAFSKMSDELKADVNNIEDSIRKLCQEQAFAVLAAQGKGQPYTVLIGFAASQDLRRIVFTTPKHTRKYHLIERGRRVSLLVDNRSQQEDSINQISAVTITGTARILTDRDEIEFWASLLTDKHPYLKEFVKSSSTATILVEAVRYFYVRRFQEVFEWSPAT